MTKKPSLQFIPVLCVVLMCFIFAACPEDAVDDGPQVIHAGDLTFVVDAPQTGGTPQIHDISAGSSFNLVGISWTRTADGSFHEGVFAPDVAYSFAASVSPRPGYTLSGMTGEFTHNDAVDGGVTLINNTLTIQFIATEPDGQVDDDRIRVTENLDLTNHIDAPVFNIMPAISYLGSPSQYIASGLAWSYTDGGSVTGVFAADREIRAVITLSPRNNPEPGFTFSGLASNAFTHTGSTGVSFISGTGRSIIVTITFAPLERPADAVVRYETHGGSFVPSATIIPGGKIILPPVDDFSYTINSGSYGEGRSTPIPTRFGYTFAGWYTDAAYTTLFDFNQEIFNSTVVHARWTATGQDDNRIKITQARAYPVRNPVTGNYPQGLYKFPYSGRENTREDYTQTMEWSPFVYETFRPNTVYTLRIVFEPRRHDSNNDGYVTTFDTHAVDALQLSGITGLPSGSGITVTGENKGESFVVTVVYPQTAATRGPRQALFEENFSSNNLDTTRWGYSNWDNRQGFSRWNHDMTQSGSGWTKPSLVNIADGVLSLGFKIWPGIADGNWEEHRDHPNWIASSAIQTTRLFAGSGSGGWGQPTEILFESTYGYFEASIRYPRHTSGMNLPWGGFWMYGRTTQISPFNWSGRYGTEIDILETLSNGKSGFNSAMHWNAYWRGHRSVGRYNDGGYWNGGPFTAAGNIYDGNFHTHALEWTPSYYRFYVNGHLFWEVPNGGEYYWGDHDGVSRWKTVEMAQNPAWMILSVEGAYWQNNGQWPPGWSEDKMEVQWVRAWNQPPGN